MRYRFLFPLALLLAGCASTTQTTSGRDYIARYSADSAAARSAPAAKIPEAARPDAALNAEVLRAAAIEPILRLPARIGVARIAGGGLSTIPEAEMAAWADLADRLGPSFGEFIPVNPLIAAMVADSISEAPLTAASPLTPPRAASRDLRATIREARLGGARQHLDAVLIYQVDTVSQSNPTAFSLANFTLIGAMILPGRYNEAQAVGAAILVDVRNGYPYGSATAEGGAARYSATSTARGSRRRVERGATEAAFLALVEEVETMAEDLRGQLGRTRRRFGKRLSRNPAAA